MFQLTAMCAFICICTLTTCFGQLTIIRSSLQNEQFAAHKPYSKFCRDDLMTVSWPKHVVNVKIQIKPYILVSD